MAFVCFKNYFKNMFIELFEVKCVQNYDQKCKGERPFGTPRKNFIKIDCKKVGWENGLDSSGSG
jgi:hypothetical protein